MNLHDTTETGIWCTSWWTEGNDNEWQLFRSKAGANARARAQYNDLELTDAPPADDLDFSDYRGLDGIPGEGNWWGITVYQPVILP